MRLSLGKGKGASMLTIVARFARRYTSLQFLFMLIRIIHIRAILMGFLVLTVRNETDDISHYRLKAP